MAVATTHIAEGIGMLVPLRPLRLSPTLWACGWQQLISSSGSSRTSVVPLPVTSKANYRLRSRLGTWRNSNLSDESVQSGLQLVNALLLVLLSSSILSSVNKWNKMRGSYTSCSCAGIDITLAAGKVPKGTKSLSKRNYVWVGVGFDSSSFSLGWDGKARIAGFQAERD